jgi:hypothetical protein
MMTTSCRRAFFSFLLLLLSTGSSTSQPLPMTWPDAVAPLAGGKSMAEACVGLLKRYGTGPQIANGQLEYVKAKSDSDAAIDGLITALATGDSPASLPTLQTRLSTSLSGLEQFCNSVKALIPASPPSGEKSGVVDAMSIIKEAIGPILTGALNGIAALYNNHRIDDALTRKSIQQELESARWPDFASVDVR